LSVSYTIVSAHGGGLDLVPDNGSGACFRVILPIKGETR
jgi:signal transduction histidine kinase